MFWKSIQRFTCFLAAMLLLILPLAWISLTHPHQIQTADHIITYYQAIFLLIRWMLIMTLGVSWHKLITYVGKKQAWPTQKIQLWQQQHLRIIVWLTLFELILCENLPLKILAWLGG